MLDRFVFVCGFLGMGVREERKKGGVGGVKGLKAAALDSCAVLDL